MTETPGTTVDPDNIPPVDPQVTDTDTEAIGANCPQSGCIRPYPHEGVRHRYAETKELKKAEPQSAPRPVSDLSPDTTSRPAIAPIEDRPILQVMSKIDDKTFVAWSNCGTCHRHLRFCTCLHGPTPPEIVVRWQNESFPVGQADDSLTPAPQEAADDPSDDLGQNYHDAVTAPRDLTAEDEQALSNLLDKPLTDEQLRELDEQAVDDTDIVEGTLVRGPDHPDGPGIDPEVGF